MGEDEFWRLERSLWLEGAKAYDRLLHPDCVMAFAPPVGVMQGAAAITKSIRQAPRWSAVEMNDPALVRSGEAIVVLAYRATARREARTDAYKALCTSSYVRDGRGWRMIQHQQTPF